MIARLVIDYFCRVFKEPSWQTAEAWESVLSTIRTSVFSNQNCEFSQHDSGDLLLTYLDGDPNGVNKNLQWLLQQRRKADLNQVSWWDGRGLRIQIEDRYHFEDGSETD